MTKSHFFLNKPEPDMASQLLFALRDKPWLPITSCFITVQTNPYEKKLVLNAWPDKLRVEASSISEKKTRTVHRLSSHVVSSLEDRCTSGERTEETQWRCCGLMYDGGAGGSKRSEEKVRQIRLAGMKSLRQSRVHRQKWRWWRQCYETRIIWATVSSAAAWATSCCC